MKARMNLSKVGCVVGGVVVGLLASMPAVQAADDVGQGGPTGPGVPGPEEVPGKEYSDNIDRDADIPPNRRPTQTLLWDGFGNVQNGFEYEVEGEVDAMANVKDHLFYEVIDNEATLVFSTAGDPKIYWEDPSGNSGIWAQPDQINSSGVTDVDGLELWGPEWEPDGNRYSLYDDPGGISVWDFSGNFPFSDPLLTRNKIGQAIGLDHNFWVHLDVDGMMTYDDHIMFSIAPVAGFDGGEIWTWNGTGLAEFLYHGGHLWDTEFEVKRTFGTVSENINALEAIAKTPEPTSVLALLAVGAIGAVSLRKRSRK